MTKQQQSEIVEAFMASMLRHVRAHVPAFPEDWDGHEIKEWIAGEFLCERTTSMRNDRSRMRRFKQAAARMPSMPDAGVDVL